MINQFDPTSRPMLEGVQGNILKAHGRHHTANVFIRCNPDDESATNTRAWLKSLVTNEVVKSAYTHLRNNALFKSSGGEIDTGLFACVHISAAGYEYLFPDDARIGRFEATFRNGMAGADLRDPDPALWEVGFRGEQHVMILLAHANPAELEKAVVDVQQAVCAFGFITTLERGNALLNHAGAGIEHFGYVDGVSQPLFFEDEWDTYKQQNHIRSARDVLFDPRADKGLVLTADPFGNGDANARGSYFVFRKLEQNVKGFKQAEANVASQLRLEGDDRERAGAMIVGRFEDGTPAQMSDEEGLINSAMLNNFDYKTADGASKCPFHAHIRKVNPRSGLLNGGMAEAKKHIMARRGIPFGSRTDGPNDGQIYNKPEGGVGLLFMSYQASIRNQFEVIQHNWANSEQTPDNDDPTGSGPTVGIDPVIGQGDGTRTGQFATVWGDRQSLTDALFPQFVTMKGGEYFFAPSMAFLNNINDIQQA
ncbi:Dyp-type peroxidase [Fibrella sp. HMF5335]|uniref:Dyp-type peroxidase n=1 Tax=Fibrella rubiginis TaxID=2817060 RepID=A0A939GH89_9BACT|nr:Dyp-type peroxidase [Fibrella rubiginis]MBO0937430.1 Dyp-type peroxidase [Fibrella rubiginis]